MPNTTFVDLFAGCGGLSLGLSMSGMRGLFAVERDPMAFETFSANLIERSDVPVPAFSWPAWLERRAWDIDDLLARHMDDLVGLRGTVEVMAGGPPCQGFSFAGQRRADDPRNRMFERYVQAVDAIRPAMLVIENVPGMKVAHVSRRHADGQPSTFYEKLREALDGIGYDMHGELVDASRFGVPQKRARLLVFGVRRDVAASLPGGVASLSRHLEAARQRHLEETGLPARISAAEAISDLEAGSGETVPCTDPRSPPGFREVRHAGPVTAYQRLMNAGAAGMDSMRMANHSGEVSGRFAAILAECPRGVRMNDANRARFGLKKNRIHPMDPHEPAPTIMTLPDDVIHYAEPRILTVRECARLQSFPDWFRFRGRFTTGGAKRTRECPRYTQVGNAVPPFLGKAVGDAILAALAEAGQAAREAA
jgi:DNA-methyltransferase (dcm)